MRLLGTEISRRLMLGLGVLAAVAVLAAVLVGTGGAPTGTVTVDRGDGDAAITYAIEGREHVVGRYDAMIAVTVAMNDSTRYHCPLDAEGRVRLGDLAGHRLHVALYEGGLGARLGSCRNQIRRQDFEGRALDSVTYVPRNG